MNRAKLLGIGALFCVLFIESSEITIRRAENKDLPILAILSKKVINEHFRHIITHGYPASPVVQNPLLLNTYLENMTTTLENIFNENQLQDNRQRLLVATQTNKPHIIGLCFSQQISDDQAYIRYIIVDKDCRHKGVGSALLRATLNSYEGITSCELKTLSHANEKARLFMKNMDLSVIKTPHHYKENIANILIASLLFCII